MLNSQADARATDARYGITRKAFLPSIKIEHGPAAQLSRFFILADAAFADLGLDLVFAGFDELEQTCLANRDSWPMLNPTFAPANGLVDPDRSFALFGVNAKGMVVSAIGGVLFDWTQSNLREEAATLRLLYKEPFRMAPPNSTSQITAASATRIRGRVAYSGAHWIHPTLRKRDLATVNARLLRAVAYARWGMEMVFGITSLGLLRKGHAARNGWAHIEPGVAFDGNPACPPAAGLVWMTAAETLDDLVDYLAERPTSRGETMQFGGTQDMAATVDLDGQYQARVANRESAA